MQKFQAALQAVTLRDMPWRQLRPDGTIDPYHILVSEIMLQQTQVSRVLPKYEAFVATWPTIQDLASAPRSEVLRLWSGLGYNRRAKFIHQAAQTVVTNFGGVIPDQLSDLISLPGIGVNTAGAILVYAFNQPTVFIETNIRTVYIHHFFSHQTAVADSAIRQKLEETLDTSNPREFYWRLMDYGTLLKKEQGNLSRKSRSYVRQSTFEGSNRQLRGQVLRSLSEGPLSAQQLAVQLSDERLPSVLERLQIEGLIQKKKQHYQLG